MRRCLNRKPSSPRQLRPVRTDQVLPGQQRQPGRDLGLLGRERLHGAAVEQLSFDGSALEHGTLGGFELVEAGCEERAESRRDVDVVCVAGHCQHLREEKRIAAGCVGNSLPQLGGQRGDQLVGCGRRQRLEAQSDRPVGALREQLGPGHADEQDRRPRGEQRHALDEVEEGLLAPLDVVEHRDQRRLLLEQLAKCPGDLLRRGDLRRLPEQRADRGSWAGSEGSASSCLITSTTGQ